MMEPFVWVLNPDCERELAAKASYAVRAAFMARIAERRDLFEGLVCGEPMFFTHEMAHKPGHRALLWCPTPRARQLAEEAGLSCSPAPPVDVLRRVHHKSFLTRDCSEQALPGRAIIESLDDWKTFRKETAGAIRTKRFFGYAGKGQRVWPEQPGHDDSKWLADSLNQGGFIAEPNINGAAQLSLHGYVDARGTLLGSPCDLETDRSGAPVRVTARMEERTPGSHASLDECGHKIAESLFAAGYFGPFGLDVLIIDDRPYVIDVNPRFTLGWSIGMGTSRGDALGRALDPKAG